MAITLPNVPADAFSANSAQERQATVTAAGTPVPIVYGRQVLGAHIFRVGLIDSELVLGCAWCLGEIAAIEDLIINGEPPAPGVTVTHYLGAPGQGVDPTLAAAITGYADTLTAIVRGEAVAIAYTVLRIPPDAVTGWPRVEAIIRSRELLGPNIVYNGSADDGNVLGWQQPAWAADAADYVSAPYSLTVPGGATRSQANSWDARAAIDVGSAYEISMHLKTLIAGRSISVWLVCEDEISVIGGAGLPIRERCSWVPARNTTLSSPALDGATVVLIHEPSAAWSTPGTHTVMLFDVPPGDNPDPAEIAVEGHVTTDVADLGGGIWQITLATALRFSHPAGTLVSNGLRPSTTNAPVLFGGSVTPGTSWQMMTSRMEGYNDLAPASPSATSGRFRRGTKYVRFAFSGLLEDDRLWLDELEMRRAGNDIPALALADFISSPVYGQGLSVAPAGVEAVAMANGERLSDGSRRREINLIIDQALPAAQWVDLLRSYAGCFVVPSGDRVKLVPNGPAAPVATITADDILEGSLRLSRRPLRDAPTVVHVVYTDTTTRPWRDLRATAYAPGVISGETPWREETVRMPGITRYAQALREAIQRLNEGRLTDLDGEWIAFDEALQLEGGDVIEMTHPIGLVAKQMRIFAPGHHQTGRWRITAVEYNAAVYSDAIGDAGGADSPLPSPSSIGELSALAAASGTEHLMLLADGSIISRMLVTWTPPANIYYRTAEIEYRKAGDTHWTPAPPPTDAAVYCSPVEDAATYAIRGRAVNSFGIHGDWVEISHVVVGKTEPPPPPQQFLFARDADGTRRFSWLPPSPLPRDLEGYLLRFRLGTGHTYETMTPLHEGVLVSSPHETNQLAAGIYTFALVSMDTTDHISTPVYITAELGDPRLAGALEIQQSHLDSWPGTKTDCWVDPHTGELIATGKKTWADFATDNVQWEDWQQWARDPNTLTYTATVIDVGSVLRFLPLLSGDYSGTATFETRTSLDNVSWTGWSSAGGQVNARYVQARVTVAPAGGNVPVVRALTLILDATIASEDINDLDTSTLTGSYRIGVGDIRLPVTKSYGVIRKIDLALQNVGPHWTWDVIDKNVSPGPRVKIYNASGALADAVIDATVRGV